MLLKNYQLSASLDEEINRAQTKKDKFEIAFREFIRRIMDKLSSSYIGKAYKVCVAFFESGAEWAKEYIFRPTERLLKNHIMRNTKSNRTETRKRDKDAPSVSECKKRVEFTNDTVRQSAGIKQFYICRLVNDAGKVIYQKIGTTTRDTIIRMAEHIHERWDEGVRKCIVDRVYDTKELPEETVESHFRAIYGRKHPDKYIKNDRFSECVIDLKEADDEFVKFMMGA